MKRIFLSVLTLAAFVACQNDFESDLDMPQGGGGATAAGAHKIYAEVGIGEADTKATYGSDFSALWEENDQLALLQEHANYDTTFGTVNKLNIVEGYGTSYARFNGEITVDATAPRIYHVAYPASAVSFSTTSELSLVGSVTYENSSSIAGYQLKAHGTYNYTYTSTLNITVPTTQNGKWEPYMYASTSEAVSANAIGAKTLNTLTGAIAIRAYEADGKTPKQLKSVTITSSDAAIAGSFSGTAQSNGSLGEVVGDETAWHTAFEQTSAQDKALASLESKVKTMAPATTTQTKALSLSFVGSDKEITATNLESIASDADGVYTYCVNVAPATLPANTLTITAVGIDGSTLTRVIDKEVTIAASHRAGFLLTWESATLEGATIETWYDEYTNEDPNFNLAASTIYVDNVKVQGNVSAEQVLAIGVKLNDVFHEASQQSGVLSIEPIVISGLTSGSYKVQPVAKVLINGEEKWLECGEVTKNVTTIPEITSYEVRSSYSYNGSQSKTNSIDGSLLKIKANLSDSYIANNLVDGKKYTIHYGSNTATHTLGSEWSKTLAYGSWGKYDCYVTVVLGNGYTLTSTKYTTHVTGIPCSYAFYNNGTTDISAAESAGWKFTGTGTQSDQVWICKANSVGVIGSPKFHIPANISTTSTLSHRFYHIGSGSINAYVGASSSPSSAVKTTTFTVGRTLDTGETGNLLTHKGEDTDVVLTSSAPYITITSDAKSKYSTAYHYVHAIKIEYR